jgi:two-component system CheB/CheR fusion protein
VIHELLTTKAQLQATLDDLETANEEMRSISEEYQSVNEELQSTNEELETSKEEMQSINEELQTVNAEMFAKNEALIILNSDFKNLLDSTQIATIFLDDELCIKSCTPGMTDIFRLRQGDRGRPITEIVTLLDYTELQRDLRRCSESFLQ